MGIAISGRPATLFMLIIAVVYFLKPAAETLIKEGVSLVRVWDFIVPLDVACLAGLLTFFKKKTVILQNYCLLTLFLLFAFRFAVEEIAEYGVTPSLLLPVGFLWVMCWGMFFGRSRPNVQK